MMDRMRFSSQLIVGIAFGILPGAATLVAQEQPLRGTITFKYENPKLQPAAYEMTLRADGSGHFISHAGSQPPADIANLPSQGQERDITIAPASRDRLFGTAAKEHFFATKCDSGNSKIAFQGTKTLSYEGPEGRGSCTYNYSLDPKIQWLTTELEGLAATLEAGRRLKLEHEHGRLNLDSELGSLTDMVKAGQATELQNIAPILNEIAADEDVMSRARRRAQVLADGSVTGSGN